MNIQGLSVGDRVGVLDVDRSPVFEGVIDALFFGLSDSPAKASEPRVCVRLDHGFWTEAGSGVRTDLPGAAFVSLLVVHPDYIRLARTEVRS